MLPDLPPRLRDRYRLDEPLSAGMARAVWRAGEVGTGREVVLKVLPGGLERAARAELAALRVLDLPGVVRLLDDWDGEDGETILVTEWVDGERFPAGAEGWAALRPLVVRTLRILRQVHAAGVVHRDLKPEHVCVGANGSVTLLDFGLAWGSGVRLGSAEPEQAGTLRYAAPEQLTPGAGVDGRTDLYSLGLLVWEALTGAVPHDAPTERSLVSARLAGELPPLPEGVPDEAARLLRGLLARKPRQRLPDADAALEVLEDETLAAFDAATAHWKGRLDADSLRRLFAGPERLLHIPTDAAALLLRDHHGEARATAAAVRGWLRRGEARWEQGAVVVDRGALRRLGWAPRPEPREDVGLTALLLAQRWGEAAEQAIVRGEAAWQDGQLDEAGVVLSQGLHAAELAERPALARRLTEGLTRVGLSGNSARATALALHELHRCTRRQPDLEDLLQADRLVREGDLERARDRLRALEPYADEALDRWRPALAIRLAQRQGEPSHAEAALAFADDWAQERGTATAEGDALNWRGLEAYRAGRIREAFELHGEAAFRKEHGSGRLSARGNQVAALVELADLRAAAVRAAETLKTEAEALRNPIYEGYAAWALRTLAYRDEQPLRPDRPLIEAAGSLGNSTLQAQLWFSEAAVAWRGRDLPFARDLAERAATAWRGDGRDALVALARALALASTPATPAEVALRAAEALRERALAPPIMLPGVWLQALGVLAWTHPQVRHTQDEALRTLAAAVPADLRVGRRELLSQEEILEAPSHPPP